MAKNVYLVVSDLHYFYKNFESRINYDKETDFIKQQIITTAHKYKKTNYNVNLCLLGDVFHGAYRDVTKAIIDSNFFVLFSLVYGSIFCTVGNHELTYRNSNPFYTLMRKIESEKLKRFCKIPLTAKGIIETVRIVDHFEDGELMLHFNHYGTAINKAVTGKVNIALFHQEILCKQIVDTMQNQLQENVFKTHTINFDSTDIFDGFSYCFFGHTHKIFGTWVNEKGCVLSYLASLNRTNVTEINDESLERNIPAILVEDGIFCGVEDNLFKHLDRLTCVNEENVAKNKQIYTYAVQKQNAKKYEPLSDDPVKSLRTYFAEDVKASNMLDTLLNQELDDEGFNLKEKIWREIGYENQ